MPNRDDPEQLEPLDGQLPQTLKLALSKYRAAVELDSLFAQHFLMARV